MQKYSNLSGKSGVTGFQIYEAAVAVEFSGKQTYLYSYQSAGVENVEKMKRLARKGEGLATFISRYVPHDYARKLR